MWKSLQKSFDSQESFVSLALGLAVVLAIGVLLFNYINRGKGAATQEQTDQQKEAEKMTLPTQHTVQKGETLWNIAEKYYKSGYNWVDLQKANNIKESDKIEVGQTLTVPDVAPIIVNQKGQITATSSTESGKTEKKTYTVAKGDSLWSIAVKELGNGYEWTKIAKMNNLKNPGLIHSGNVLTLP